MICPRSLDHGEGADCFGAMRCGKHDGEGTIGMSDQMSRAIEEPFEVRRVNLEIAVLGDRIGRISAPINEGHSPPFSKYLLALPGLLARRHLPVHEYDSRPGARRCRMRCPPLTRSDVAHQGHRLPDQQHPCFGNDRGRPESAKAVAIERMGTWIMASRMGTSRAPGTGEVGHPWRTEARLPRDSSTWRVSQSGVVSPGLSSWPEVTQEEGFVSIPLEEWNLYVSAWVDVQGLLGRTDCVEQ